METRKEENDNYLQNQRELKLLGVCLSNKSKFDSDASRLTEEHFVFPLNKLFFEAMFDYHNKTNLKEFEDTELIEYILKKNNSYTSNDIVKHMSNIIMDKGLETKSKEYTNILIQSKIKRDLQIRLTKVESMLRNGNSIQEVTEEMNKTAMETQDFENSKFGLSPAEFFEEHYEKVMELKGKPFGFLTGWNKFDKMIGGIEKGTITTFGARPSMGKTALGVNLAYNIAKSGTPVLFFSAEMSGADVSSRFMPYLTHIGTKYNKDYNYLEKDVKRRELVKWGMEKLKEIPIKVDDHPALAIEDIVWKLPRYASEGYKVFVIDYLQFIQMRGRIGQGKDHERISFIMATLKTLAKKYNVAIVLLAQIGRVIEQRDNKRPMLSDLKGASSIEENSDKVIAIHRPWYYLGGFSQENKSKRENKIQSTELIVLKNRNGAVGDIKFWYYMDYNIFKEDFKEPIILEYNSYITNFVQPMRKEKEREMMIEKGETTQEIVDEEIREKQVVEAEKGWGEVLEEIEEKNEKRKIKQTSFAPINNLVEKYQTTKKEKEENKGEFKQASMEEFVYNYEKNRRNRE